MSSRTDCVRVPTLDYSSIRTGHQSTHVFQRYSLLYLWNGIGDMLCKKKFRYVDCIKRRSTVSTFHTLPRHSLKHRAWFWQCVLEQVRNPAHAATILRAQRPQSDFRPWPLRMAPVTSALFTSMTFAWAWCVSGLWLQSASYLSSQATIS
jgi:hypothetical protein